MRIVGKETKAMHKKPEIAPDTALLCAGIINDLAISLRTVSMNPGAK